MKFLSGVFNRRKMIAMSREQLAEIVMPLIPGKGEIGNAAIAKGWEEAAEWLRIGFDAETDKGSLYHALHKSLRMIAGAIKTAPEDAGTVDISADIMGALKASFVQLTEASYNLDSMSRQKAAYEPRYVQDRQGNTLAVPFTQIYNRPEAAHDLMGMKLEDIQENLERFFAQTPVKEASNALLESYVPQRF